MGSTASRLEPLRGGSLLFTTKFPEISGTHFTDLGRMKGWVDLGATQRFWTQNPWIRNPAPWPLGHCSNCILVFGHEVSMWLFITYLDDFWHIVHVTAADFNCIAVENCVKFVASRKMISYQLKECLCNGCWNGFAKGWVKLHYVFLFFWFAAGVFRINIITRRLSHIFVFNCHCIKNFLVRRVFRQSIRDGIWKLFDNLRWMVWPWVDVK